MFDSHCDNIVHCYLQDIITHRLPLAEVEKGLKLVNSSKESIKVVLLPSQDCGSELD